MTNLYLIRHGESTVQQGQSQQNDGLSPLGVAQAERLRDRLAATGEIAADVLIASTYPRAQQTAEIIAPALGLPIVCDDELQELRTGEEAFTLTAEEFKARFGNYQLEEKPLQPVAPGGENWGQFALRAGMALDRIVRQYAEQTIVVVCHGGIIDCSFLYFFGMETLVMPRTRFYTLNTSITHWRKSGFGTRPARWRLVRYNDDLHVRDIDSPVCIPWEHLPLPQRRDASRQAQPPLPPTEKE